MVQPLIFINYRRNDTAGTTGRMVDSLKEFINERYFFIDVNSINEGENFPVIIKKSIEQCEVLIAVIGPGWLASINHGIDNEPTDWARTEIATALKKKKHIIPVLVQGATMPSASQLPKDLKGFDKYNAAELSHTRWQYDVERLANTLHKTGIPFAKEEKRSERKMIVSIVAVIAIVLAAFILVKEVVFKEPVKQAILTPLKRKAPLVEGKWTLINSGNSLLRYGISQNNYQLLVEEYNGTTRTSVGDGNIDDEGKITVNMVALDQSKTEYHFKLSADKTKLLGTRSIGTMKGPDKILYIGIKLEKMK